MKAVMLSLRPQWCEKIFNGSKTIEVRKSRPSLDMPFRVYVYQTKIKFKVKNWQENFQSIVFTPNGGVEEGNGKVIGSFVCDRIVDIQINGDDCGNYWHEWDDECDIEDMCLSYEELETYLGKSVGYGWHISKPKLFDKPREIEKFIRGCDDMLDPQFGSYCGYCPQPCFLKRPPQSWCYVEN